VPRKRATSVLSCESRAERDVSPTFRDRGQEKRQFTGSIAVVSVEKHDNIGGIRCSETHETCTPISPARFAQDARPPRLRNLGRSVSGVAVNHQDFGDDSRGEIGEDTSDGLRFVVRGNDDGDAHWLCLDQPPLCVRPASSKPLVEAKDSARAPD